MNIDEKVRFLEAACTGMRKENDELQARLEAALASVGDLVAFVRLVHGDGPDCVLPETIKTPMGIPVRIAEIIRDAERVAGEPT